MSQKFLNCRVVWLTVRLIKRRWRMPKSLFKSGSKRQKRPVVRFRNQKGDLSSPRSMEQVNIGIIGGSGLYQMPELANMREIAVDTAFGMPSDSFIVGELDGVSVAFLPRHGRGHRLTPSEVPFRSNIYGMKLLGIEYILSVSAVGSLQEKYAPTDMVIPDQFFDRTRARAHESTFFGEGIVAHVTFAHPVCGALGDVLEQSCKVA